MRWIAAGRGKSCARGDTASGEGARRSATDRGRAAAAAAAAAVDLRWRALSRSTASKTGCWTTITDRLTPHCVVAITTIRPPKTQAYEELDKVAVPEDVPELGIRAGTLGTVATVYDAGRMLDIEVSRRDGTTVGFVDLEVGDEGQLKLVAYAPLRSRCMRSIFPRYSAR